MWKKENRKWNYLYQVSHVAYSILNSSLCEWPLGRRSTSVVSKKSIFKSGLYVKLKMSHKQPKNRSHLINVPFYGWNRASLLSAIKWQSCCLATFRVEYFNQTISTRSSLFIDPVLAICDSEKIYWTPQCQAPTITLWGSGNKILIPHSVEEPSRK